MPGEPTTGLFEPQPRQLVVRDLVERSRRRLDALSDGELARLLEDALFQERRRLEKAAAAEGERERLDALARALVRGERDERVEAALALVRAWAEEVHGRFDPKVYRFATRLLPTAITGLLSARPHPDVRAFLAGVRRDLDVESRVIVRGDTAWLRELASEATLVLCPTHVSNLDSPLIGLALYLAGLPPFLYGAGLNLFSNPVMGWFMRRLGAYTVDRTKSAALYKEVLKDYSTRALVTHHHSLFFPGGTRSRSGHLESALKKGLLGTAITAWQELLDRDATKSEVYVVPMTLSFQLCLEANTLINDHLEREGQSRFIITDDEFAEPRTVTSFARRVLDLDDSIVLHFGAPLDCLGNPVARDAAQRRVEATRRRRFVCDAAGRVEWDAQRDHVYTERLASALVAAYPRGAAILSTHLAAWVVWRLLEERTGSTDAFRLVRVPDLSRRFTRDEVLARLRRAKAVVAGGALAGRWEDATPEDAEAVLAQALDRFGRYHRSHALLAEGGDLFIEDPKLCLYYRNRLDSPYLLADEPTLHGAA